jgi:membrane protease YdiL (CAAX protease family)
MLIFWGMIAGLALACAGREAIVRWVRPAEGLRIWPILGVGLGLLSLPQFVRHHAILDSAWLIALWLAFGLVNPWFEEGYWRGLLLDATARWPVVLRVSYSSVLFAVSHPWIWGVHSEGMRDLRVVPVLAIIGALWAIVRLRSGTLRWNIVGHAGANLLGLSVPILLGLHSPVPPVEARSLMPERLEVVTAVAWLRADRP